MLDVKWICENKARLDDMLGCRGLPPLADRLVDVYHQHKVAKQSLEGLLHQRKTLAQQQAQSFSQEQIQQGSQLKEAIKAQEDHANLLQEHLQGLLETLPNLFHPETPDRLAKRTEMPEVDSHHPLSRDGLQIQTFGDRRLFPKEISFEAETHEVLGERMGWLDMKTAAEITGARYTLLRGDLARLERSLIFWMLDQHAQAGYEEISGAALANTRSVWNVGHLPKFAQDLFRSESGEWLISTGEVLLTNLVQDKILPVEQLPLKFTGITPCFRKEAGATGKDSHGLIRAHQFSKVEIVQVCTPEQEDAEHQKMLTHLTGMLTKLGLYGRVIDLFKDDLGFSASRTWDMEVWMPGAKQFREISSLSACHQFQSRRMRCRYTTGEKPKEGYPLVCTLNGSGFPTGRTLAAILENFQQSDGRVRVPDVLVPYMGKEWLTPNR